MKSNLISISSFLLITSNTIINSFQIYLPSSINKRIIHTKKTDKNNKEQKGWTETSEGEWEWKEEDAAFDKEKILTAATPKLPSGTFKPKQSLGQNFLKDGNTVGRIVSAFEKDVQISKEDDEDDDESNIVELGPGAGALTRPLYELYKSSLTCVELDPRSIEILSKTYPELNLIHKDVLQLDYTSLATSNNKPLSIIGNLPYYITSQILFALADATHHGSILSATVTLQWEVALRITASTRTKDYGILSIVFQLYSNPNIHFKIPPTVFYPKPKVDSALIGLQFVSPDLLRLRLGGVQPLHLRTVLSTVFQQRRKTLRNGIKKLLTQVNNNDKEKVQSILSTPPILPKYIQLEYKEKKNDCFSPSQRILPIDWYNKRPEELNPGQFVELTRLVYGPYDVDADSLYSVEFPDKVWRKMKHGNG